MMAYNTQNYWVFGLCPSSSILKTREHKVSERDPVSENPVILNMIVAIRDLTFLFPVTLYNIRTSIHPSHKSDVRKERYNAWKAIIRFPYINEMKVINWDWNQEHIDGGRRNRYRMPRVFCSHQAKHRDSLWRRISGLEAATVFLFSQSSTSVTVLK
jgi:hypothetical protein